MNILRAKAKLIGWISCFAVFGALFFILFCKSIPIGIGGIVVLGITAVIYLILLCLLQWVVRKMILLITDYKDAKIKAAVAAVVLLILAAVAVSYIVGYANLPNMGDPAGQANSAAAAAASEALPE